MELNEFLRGKRTYLVCGVLGVLMFGSWQKWWVVPDELSKGLLAAGLFFLRAAVGQGQERGEGRGESGKGTEGTQVN